MREGRVVMAGFNYKDERRMRGAFSARSQSLSVIGADRSGRIAIDWGVYGAPRPS